MLWGPLGVRLCRVGTGALPPALVKAEVSSQSLQTFLLDVVAVTQVDRGVTSDLLLLQGCSQAQGCL